ncbi:MAG: rhomboid family intramembrane serine protease [Ignavibacteriae bacterium]|nr:rhomboid family intramembrane serine protease [Ignavibacteria bacterium]MBI3364194.1 rhomboid family intramembrane serine protease [Ignavibacteriota bacterium]
MIPLRDANPSETTPFVNYTLIAVNGFVFLFELSLGRGLNAFIFDFGLIPSQFLADLQSMNVGLGTFLPLFTSMFLHGGWFHFLGNMLYLYVFGDNVEDKFGHVRYLFFYFTAGLAAALTQVFINQHSEVPMVGASGAIAGVLGAYIFMFPRAKVATLIPIFIFFQVVELPAFVFLGIWFLMQSVSGIFSLRIASDVGGVAFWAHIGGFAAGAILFPFLRKPRWR